MLEWLKRRLYVTEPKFDFADYRKPIPWFDKSLIVCGLAAGIAGRLAGGAWLLRLVVSGDAFADLLPLLMVAVLLWLPGDYFRSTGNRGLIYHHMDILTEYLAKRVHGSPSVPDDPLE
jgi:hypothetical protein